MRKKKIGRAEGTNGESKGENRKGEGGKKTGGFNGMAEEREWK